MHRQRSGLVFIFSSSGHVCSPRSLCQLHTQRNPMTIPRGTDEPEQKAQLIKDKWDEQITPVLPFWLCDSSMFSSIVASYSPFVSIVWSCLKPLASSQHSVRVCVCGRLCVLERVIFSLISPCRWWRLREVPVSILCSLSSHCLFGLFNPPVSVIIYRFSFLYRYWIQ